MLRNDQKGYVGLIALMLSVTILALLFARAYLSPRAVPLEQRLAQPLTASGTVPETGIEQVHADINAASAVRDMLNKQNIETNRQLKEVSGE